ncbi:MAG: gamma-glutamylcyclotransferase [Piscinibacter sp.]
MPSLVFVYGTLKQGFRNSHVNTGVRVPGEFVSVQRYPLYVIGPQHLPWLVDRAGQGEPVLGQLYEVDDAGLARMDALERITEPDWYRRGEILVRREGEADAAPVRAMVYFGSARRLDSEVVHLGPVPAFSAEHAALHRAADAVGRGPGFAVLYRWRLQPGAEDSFVAAWTRISALLRSQRGSLGSRLHRGPDGWWYSYAQWPSAEARARAFDAAPVDAEASARMQAAIVESLPELVLEPVADLMLSAPRDGA